MACTLSPWTNAQCVIFTRSASIADIDHLDRKGDVFVRQRRETRLGWCSYANSRIFVFSFTTSKRHIYPRDDRESTVTRSEAPPGPGSMISIVINRAGSPSRDNHLIMQYDPQASSLRSYTSSLHHCHALPSRR